MQSKCYECLDFLGSSYHTVKYPAKNIAGGEMLKDNPEVIIYLCDECFNENEDKVIEEYE